MQGKHWEANQRASAKKYKISRIRFAIEKHLFDQGYKYCRSCHSVKDLAGFTSFTRTRLGYYNKCNKCRQVVVRNWRAKDIEHHRQHHAEWSRNWRKIQKEKDPIAYKFKIFMYRQRRRERKLRNGDCQTEYIKIDLAKDLFKQCNGVCLCCGSADKLSIDHIVPVSKGGLTVIDNLQILCTSCNCSKRDKIIDYRKNVE